MSKIPSMNSQEDTTSLRIILQCVNVVLEDHIDIESACAEELRKEVCFALLACR